MVRKHFFLVAAFAVLVLMLVGGGIKLLTRPDKTQGAGAAARAAAVTPVAAGPHVFNDQIQALGQAKGRQSVTLTSNTAQLVAAVRFRDGQYVSKGQVLVELKADEQDAGIAQARAQAAQADRDYQRYRTLAEKGIAASAMVEQYRSAMEAAHANVEAAQARRGDRVIRAPFAGRVGLSDIAPGALIAAGSPIATLDDVSVVRVDFDVPDRYLPVLHEGAPVSVRADAYPDAPVVGRIVQLNTRVDTATRAITARAEAPNPEGRFKPGMMMRVTLKQGQRQAVAVPETAVQFESDQAYVFAIAKTGDKTVAQRRAVTTGANEGGFIEITSGLKAGETVVGDGLNRIQDGQPVRAAASGPDKAKAGAQAAR